ncbi:diguanylate cyclase [Azospirillum sp. SYSU D00513]|uniref:sensor domain-containing diguanylate cyclase n=1 Tax=Azospirillum sp. SYSU D00513 TaxID=2812561 RepID=UPI001A95C80F|nr:diguanylate cyclase [Azospirillum sp. SYSU D00513]
MLNPIDGRVESAGSREREMESWRSVFDASPAGVCIAAPGGTILYANPALHDLLGYPAQGLRGLAMGLLAPGTGGEAGQGEGVGRPGERPLLHRDGGVVWLSEAVSPLPARGEVLTLRILTDVSGYRRTAAEQRDQFRIKEVLFETLPVPVFIKNGDGLFIDCNPAFERYTGLTRDAIVRKSSLAVMGPDLASPHVERDRALAADWDLHSYEEEVPFGDGSTRRTSITKAAFADESGRLAGIVGVINDLSEGIPTEARLQTILEQSPIGVSVSRRSDGRILFANTRFAELIGLPRERIVGSLARDYYRDADQRGRVVERLKAGGSVVNMEVEFQRADGSPFWALFTVNQAVVLGTPVNLAWIYDYTERRSMEETLRDMASRDPLTGIHNRRAFMDLARQQVLRAQRLDKPVSVFVLDLDHFKSINDTHGHVAGDEALRMVAGCCQLLLRGYDLLGRMGGEEFVVLLPGAPAEVALRVAERVRQQLERTPVLGPEGPFQLTASIGVACMQGPEDTLDRVIHRADQALYRAKNGGRNRVAADGPALAEPVRPL